MKKAALILLGGFLLMVAPLSRAAAEGPASAGWYLGLGMGVDPLIQGWDSDYFLGGGGNVFAGCRLNPSTELQLSVSPWFYTGGGLSVIDLRVTPEVKLLNPSSGWAPYFLMGPGYDLQFDSPSGYFTSSLAVVAGIGFQFDFRKGEHAFIEGRYSLLLYKNLTQVDVPVLVGLSEDL